ncbi:MAG: glycosyltransferase family 2 protein [Deltaproteobacteria bacterium]|nr:glycosyltransferase family 2 protein [Deltaproteobacteria bacterium]
MYLGVRVAVVVPAHNESDLISEVLRRMPALVDQVVVVDDASDDDTCARVRAFPSDRVLLVQHVVNRGVGAAIMTGYRVARSGGAEVVAVMAGDDQMDPADLEEVVRPVAQGRADYVKGDRLHHPQVADMPWTRRIGSHLLTWMTRRAIGVDELSDSQCGYTAISGRAIDALDLGSVWPRFGYPNDLLARIVGQGISTTQVVVRPVYKGERSELRPWHALTIMSVVIRAGWRAKRGPLTPAGSRAKP